MRNNRYRFNIWWEGKMRRIPLFIEEKNFSKRKNIHGSFNDLIH